MSHVAQDLHVGEAILHRVLHCNRRIDLARRRIVRSLRRLDCVPELTARLEQPHPAARARVQARRFVGVQRLGPMIPSPFPPAPPRRLKTSTHLRAKRNEPPLHAARDEIIRAARRRHVCCSRRSFRPVSDWRHVCCSKCLSVAKREPTSAFNLRKLLAVGGALLAGRAASASSRLACGFAEPTASPNARIVRTHGSAK
eukprot:363092-Prymnesium_polylepis.1